MPKSGAKQQVQHWGRWVLDRAKAVGFRRQLDVAAAVGVTPEHLSRWGKMHLAPEHMRRGYDDALARALKVDRATLFEHWHEVDPKAAPRVEADPERSVPWDASSPEDDRLRREIEVQLGRLHGVKLYDVWGFVLTLLTENPSLYGQRLSYLAKELNEGRYKPPKQ